VKTSPEVAVTLSSEIYSNYVTKSQIFTFNSGRK